MCVYVCLIPKRKTSADGLRSMLMINNPQSQKLMVVERRKKGRRPAVAAAVAVSGEGKPRAASTALKQTHSDC